MVKGALGLPRRPVCLRGERAGRHTDGLVRLQAHLGAARRIYSPKHEKMLISSCLKKGEKNQFVACPGDLSLSVTVSEELSRVSQQKLGTA